MSEKYFAYVDETGDLGDLSVSPKASPHFGMAAILFPASAAGDVRRMITDLKDEFRVPHDKPFSWKEYVRDHDRRLHVADHLSMLDKVQAIYVYTDKAAVTEGTYTTERGALYNYVAGKMLKNILWAARNSGVKKGDLTIRFSHVKGFDHDSVSRPYLETTLPAQQSLPMELLDSLQWVAATKYRESDVADLFAGCLNEALRPGRYGHVEGRYLRTVWPRVRGVENCTSASNYCAVPLGFMAMPNYKVISPGWFPCPDCPKIK